MLRDRKLKTTFGSVSNLYDSARPSYPQNLINDVIVLSKIPKKGRILEVGCGSGKATAMLGEKGYDILALDISNDLIKLGRKNTSSLPNIHYKVISFEDDDLESSSFDLIVAAQAWHWIDPKIRYKKAHKILKDSGAIAIFWKHQNDKKSGLVKKVRNLYVQYCPKFPDDYEERTQHFRESIQSSNLFENIMERTYEVNIEYTKEDYLSLVQTFSWVAALSIVKRENLLAYVSKLLDQEKEPLSIPYMYTLLVAKRK